MTTDDAPLEEYTDDTLAGMILGFGEEGAKLLRLASAARFELENRLQERKATKLDTERYTGSLRPGAIQHTVDDVLRFQSRIRGRVSGDDLDRAFPLPPIPGPRADHRVINELAKRGGEVAEIIDEERTSTRGRPTLDLTHKEPVAREEQPAND